MNTSPRGLGRGLEALIPPAPSASTAPAPDETRAGLLELPITAIAPNPRQPRSSIANESLDELAASIREHGVIQPLIVTRSRPGSTTPYQLVAGERRWRAAQLAGLTTVPALVKEASTQESLVLALVENVQRADLNPLEEAAAYQTLMAEFGLSQAAVAAKVGRSRAAIANTVRLLRLPERVKTALAEGVLTEGHARALLSLPDEETILLAAEQIIARGLSVRQAEELVRRMLAVAASMSEEEPAAEADDPDAAYTRRLEDDFRSALGTKVALSRGRRGGRLVVYFYSDEELQAIYEQIVNR